MTRLQLAIAKVAFGGATLTASGRWISNKLGRTDQWVGHRHSELRAEGEDRLDQLRRAAEWRRQEQQSARALITDADIIALFEPRAPREAWPSVGSGDPSAALDPHPSGGGRTGRAAVPGFVSPALMLLAAVSILQGYTLLNVLPDGGWQTSALLFAAVTFPLSVLLTRPPGGRPPPSPKRRWDGRRRCWR